MTGQQLKIAVVSDLHIGDKAREYDLQPNGRMPYDGHLGYIDYFKKVVAEQDLSADLLVVSGDVTHEAKPSQFQHAAKVIKRLADALSVPEGQVIVVPGNHDLNWDIAGLAASEPFWLDYRFAPFEQGSQEAGCSETMSEALVLPPHYHLFEHPLADIWCFNSAAYDLPDQKPHRGEIKESHRIELKQALDRKYSGSEKGKHRIFVTHHHPKPQPDLYPDIPDFSGMVNGESLLDLLMDHSFDIVFHGHKHRPWCRPFLEAGKQPIVVWCSGSFAQTLGSAYYGSIGNLWHLAEIQGVNDASHRFGVVQSWAFAPSQGWVPSRPAHHGIDHLTPFGYLADKSQISDLMRAQLTTALQTSSHVSWESISAQEAVLGYQAGPVVWRVLEELVPEFNCRLHGERDSLDGLLVVREAGNNG